MCVGCYLVKNNIYQLVPTSCPIDMTCVNGDEPSNPTPLLDKVTPVPCVSVNFISYTDIENISL